eukprot:TRINITY_DN2069_c0_g4_i1.p1 TRINITY_DN2069_c0_g4~~TRINITY_DN2069_c0_g4_i1.p1  ORF type:complete len:107 (+),score=3.28 TRINITY_DN2069_c0_g4_i1:247-567(+)
MQTNHIFLCRLLSGPHYLKTAPFLASDEHTYQVIFLLEDTARQFDATPQCSETIQNMASCEMTKTGTACSLLRLHKTVTMDYIQDIWMMHFSASSEENLQNEHVGV